MTPALTLLALLQLSSPLSADAVRLDAGDLARGFGAGTPVLTQVVGELEELGLPARLELALRLEDGSPAAEARVLAAWRGDRTLLDADAQGRVRLSLDGERLETLELVLPDGVTAEIDIPWIEELGIETECPSSDALVRAVGC